MESERKDSMEEKKEKKNNDRLTKNSERKEIKNFKKKNPPKKLNFLKLNSNHQLLLSPTINQELFQSKNIEQNNFYFFFF